MQPPASDEGSSRVFSKLAGWGWTAAAAKSRHVSEKVRCERSLASLPFRGGALAQPTGSHGPALHVQVGQWAVRERGGPSLWAFIKMSVCADGWRSF
ncbi:hypothetical protein TNIN_333851 [Trichonephila inaurata madagascariensis]|uniref:Uncharacterized protein n=1 Tax=Trichonephila inaurata madagascariensis TaxID=2747483 RepID=A0A8X6YGQ7_9ARAC|nr:hypothetical protein TNIN_333851 [Trichonephila inaurata madagascariensis]